MNGESQQKLIRRIKAVTGRETRGAKRIAQTERNRVQSQGRNQAIHEAAEMGLSMQKQWIARLVNTREMHEWVHLEIVDEGEKFSNGLEYPGDPNGSAENVINCFCLIKPMVKTTSKASAASREKWGKISFDEYRKEVEAGRALGVEKLNEIMLEKLEKKAYNEWGVKTVDLKGLDAKAVSGTFKQMDKAIREYPILKGSITSISAKDMRGIMSTDFSGNLYFNKDKYALRNIEELKKSHLIDLSTGFRPLGTSWEDTGIHELGHRLNAEVIKKQYGVNSFMINDWRNNVTAKKIIDKSIRYIRNVYNLKGFKRDELLSTISLYSTSTYGDDGEALAEAFTDVLVNGAKAKVLSQKIIKTLKELMEL